MLMELSQTFADMSKVKNLSGPTHLFPAEVEQGHALPSRFSFHPIHKCPFTMYLVLYFSHFVLSVGDFCGLKWRSSILLKCCLTSLSAEGCDVPYGENVCVR